MFFTFVFITPVFTILSEKKKKKSLKHEQKSNAMGKREELFSKIALSFVWCLEEHLTVLTDQTKILLHFHHKIDNNT